MKIKKSILIWIAFVGFAALLNAQTTQQVTAIQYYYDTDPGVGNTGNGAIVSVTPTSNLDQVFSLNVPATLVNGFHYLYVRAQDEYGSWSLAERRLFVIQSITATENITDYAYYFDTDPGVGNPGNGAIVPVTPTANFSSTVAITVPASLTEGFHYLYMRTKDASGQWSITERRLFVIQSITATENITDYAYYFDTDPGVGNPGNGAIVPVTPTANFSATVAITVPASLTEGFHYLYMRTRDESGQWSLSERRLFVNQAITAAEDITELEWYVDTDPGVGNGNPYPLDTVGDVNATIDLGLAPCIDTGTHYLYVRAKNTAGRWSLVERLLIDVVNPEINVSGNNLSIADGDTLADVADGTDFGQTFPAIAVVHTFTIKNNGSDSLKISSLLMTGINSSSFTIGGITTPLAIAVGDSTTFTVSFSAVPVGNYEAVIHINSDDCDAAIFDFALQGEVFCQPATFSTCPANITVDNAANQCSAPVTYTAIVTGSPAPVITYAFSGVTLGSGSGDGSGSIFSKGITTVTLTATNACDTVNCSFEVTVNDTTPPTITCLPATTVSSDSGSCAAVLADYTSQVTYTDNCPFSTGFAKVSAGAAHTLALGPDGSLWAWGWNVYGEFGNGTTSPYTSNGGSAIPIKIGIDTDWVTIEAGANASYAIKSDGTLWAWGGNSTGQLGDGSIIDKLTPVQIGTATNWVSIASSYRSTSDVHTIGLQSNGTLWAWGANNTGQLGTGNNIYVTTPTQVGTSTDWASFDIGQFFSLAIKTNGTMWSWGSNYSFTLGTGTRFQNENSPVQIGTDNDWMRVEAGGDHGLAMKLDGTLWTWGSNQIGALAGVIGQSVGAAQRDPLQIGSATDWTSISAGSGFSLALKSNGELWSSGWSQYNQRGPGATVINALQQVGTATDWATIETGNDHSTVFKTDGTLWAWGWNVKGQLGTGAPTSTIGYINPALVVAPVFSAVVQSPAPGTLIPLGANTITFSVTDASGNKDSCTQVITVIDNEKPVIICPADITGVIATSASGAVVNYMAPIGTDNCIGVNTSLLSGLVDGATFPIGTTSVWYQATDAAGNKDSCSFNVTVVGVAPQISCPANIVQNNTPGSCNAIVNFSATETAGIPASVITYSIASGSLFNVGTVSVTATATNAVGFSSCTFNVTVNDDEMPATPTLPDVTGECSATATASTTTDNCAGTITGTTTDPLTYSTQGTHVIQWTFDDGNGNLITVNQNVIVDDVTPPPTLTLLDRFGECSAWAKNDPRTIDNCAGIVFGTTNDPLTYSTQGTHVIQWTFDDGNGNPITVYQNVIVNDVTPPATPVLADVTGECSATATAPTTTDNCAGVITGTTTDPLTYSTQGTHVIQWTFDDGNGNPITVNQNVIVNDVTPPTTPVLADVTGECSAMATASTTTDNCAGIITGTTTDPLTYTMQGTYVIQWTFDDGNGNPITVNQNVIVNDVTAPVIPTLADVTGECSAIAGTASTTDNCTGTVVGTTSDPLSYSTQGTHLIQWTFDDGNGNPITVNQNVIVDDVTLPTVVTKNISVTLSGGTASIVAADVEDGSSDNCGVDFPLSTVSPNTFGCNTLGANTVTLMVTDVNGNANTATATVNVIAEISSCSITSTPNSSVYTGGNPNTLFLGYGAQSTTLNVSAIGGSVWTYNWNGNTSLLSSTTSGNPVFTPTGIGSYTYTVTSTNEFGCSTTCSITIEVIDVNCSNNANNHKVIICHNGKTICVSINAASSHLSTYSADYVGPCVSSNKTGLTGGGNLNVMAYPSPYYSTFNIDIITSSENPVDITLYGMDGKILEYYTNLNPADAPPMGAGLADGMYILSVTQNGIIKRIKVTKE